MNSDKAEEIVIVFGKALEGKNTTLSVRRKSDLKGYTLSEIDTACKLIVARYYFEFTGTPAGTPEGDELFKKVVGSFDGCISLVCGMFVDDKEFNELEKMDRSSIDYKKRVSTLYVEGINENNPDYQRYRQLESVESFGNFCRHIGRDDPLYWQKIYTHLELPYNTESPIGFV